MLHQQTTALFSFTNFSRRRLYQALAFAGVESVNPIYYQIINIKNVELGRSRIIAVFGINPDDSPLNFSTIDAQLDRLHISNVFLFDRRSRPEYGPIAQELAEGKTVMAELNKHRIKIDGVIDFVGPSFAIDGNLLTSDYTFLQVLDADADELGIGLIRLVEGADTVSIVDRLNSQLENDVKVMTLQDYVNLEKSFWARTTPIGFLFLLGVIVGFVVGVMVVYQILYGEVMEHIPDYAILKARGYKDGYFLWVLFQESILLALCGYIPGYLMAWFFCGVATNSTGLPVSMSAGRSIVVLGLSALMCMVSGLLTMRKLKEADPADLL
jgi:putative ABC transport system permease protein